MTYDFNVFPISISGDLLYYNTGKLRGVGDIRSVGDRY